MSKKNEPDPDIADIIKDWPRLGTMKDGTAVLLTKGGISVAYGGTIETLACAYGMEDGQTIDPHYAELEEICKIIQPYLAVGHGLEKK